MDKKTKQNFESGLLRLRRAYVKRLSVQISEFRRYAALLTQGVLPARDAQNLYRLSHNLTGSGLTFGFPEVSAAARLLNQALGAYMDVDIADHENQTVRRHCVYEELQRFESVCRAVVTAKQRASGHDKASAESARRVGFFVKKNEDVAPLSAAMTALGYESVYAHSMEGVKTLVDRDAAAFWVVCSGMTPREVARMEGLGQLMAGVPFYILTLRDQFDARLTALRLGAAGLSLLQPDMQAFARHLDARGQGLPPTSAARVLIVDDDDMLASFYDHALRSVAMITSRAHSAKEAYEMVERSSFSLLIMNIEMPQCSGLELAAILRQNAPSFTAPIVFVTAFDPRPGDFDPYQPCICLKKPFMPEDLIQAVQSWVPSCAL